MTTIKDSGTRDTFSTGAVRDGAAGKGRFDLLPYLGLAEVARVFEAGAKKYDARNWEKGIPAYRFLDSAVRHALKAASGETDEPHAAQAAWNLLCYLATVERIKRGELPQSLLTGLHPDIVTSLHPCDPDANAAACCYDPKTF